MLSSDNLLKQDEKHLYPFFLAASKGQLDTVKHFIEEGVNINQHYNGGSVLYFAIKEGRVEVVKYLLAQGADFNKEYIGLTPFLTSIAKGYLDIAKLFVETYHIDINKEKIPPLYLAAQEGKLDLVEYLLHAGAERKEYDGLTPLLIAAYEGQLDIVKALLRAFPEDINQINAKGETALYLAVEKGKLEVVKYLLEAGADLNLGKKTALWPAITHENVEMLRLFSKQRIQRLYWKEPCASRQMNTNIINAQNSTFALHVAAATGNLATVTHLIKHGTEINLENEQGKTALFFAIQNKHFLVVKYLIENQASLEPLKEEYYVKFFIAFYNLTPLEINKQDENGETTLHRLARAGYFKLASFLVKKGADPDIKNQKGETFWDLADLHDDFKYSSLYYDRLAHQNGFMLTLPQDIAEQKGFNCGFYAIAFCAKILFSYYPALFNNVSPLEAKKHDTFLNANASLRQRRKALAIPLDGPIFKNEYLHKLIKDTTCEVASFNFAQENFDYFILVVKESLSRKRPIIIPFSTDLSQYHPNEAHWATIVGWYNQDGEIYLITAETGNQIEYLAQDLFNSFCKTKGPIETIYPVKLRDWWYFKDTKVIDEIKKLDPSVKTKEAIKLSEHENLTFFGKTLSVVLAPGENSEEFKKQISNSIRNNSPSF